MSHFKAMVIGKRPEEQLKSCVEHDYFRQIEQGVFGIDEFGESPFIETDVPLSLLDIEKTISDVDYIVFNFELIDIDELKQLKHINNDLCYLYDIHS